MKKKELINLGLLIMKIHQFWPAKIENQILKETDIKKEPHKHTVDSICFKGWSEAKEKKNPYSILRNNKTVRAIMSSIWCICIWTNILKKKKNTFYFTRHCCCDWNKIFNRLLIRIAMFDFATICKIYWFLATTQLSKIKNRVGIFFCCCCCCFNM